MTAPEEKFLAHNGGSPTGNYPKSDLVRYVRGDIHDAAVAAARREGIDVDLISEQRLKYEALAARISVGKASQQEACDAIMQLCRDNERLAVIAGKNRAKGMREAAVMAGLFVDEITAQDICQAIHEASK